MDFEKFKKEVEKEIMSPLLQTTLLSLGDTVFRVKERAIDYKQGGIEIAGGKHILQGIAIDELKIRRMIMQPALEKSRLKLLAMKKKK